MTRQTLLVDITDRLFNDDSPETVVLLAMGGAGKTQLALEVCRQVEQSSRFGAIIWVDASSPKSVIQSYKIIAQKILKDQSYNLDDEDTIRLQVQDALRYWDGQWLMVFDNYDNPRAFQGHSIRDYLPSGRSGRTLFTSRHQDSARLGHKIDASTMTENESLKLLLQRLPLNEVESTHGRKIVSTLGYLALAIDQAGAYIRARSLDLKDFIQHYHDRKEVVLQEIPDEWEYSRTIDDEQRETRLRIFTTWELSFKQIRGQEREVKDKEHFLTLAAFFDAGNVSERYFQAYFDKSNPEWMRIFSSGDRWDSYKLGDVLSEFQKLSLLQTESRMNEGHFISIHPVICDWIKLRQSSGMQPKFATELTKALTDYLEETDVDLLSLETRLETLRHIDSCIVSDRKLSQSSGETLVCLPHASSLFARFYGDQGRYNEAEDLCRRALAGNKEKLGATDLATLGIMHDLANILSIQGQLEEAESLYSQVLVESETSLGEEHIETLLVLENLAVNYSRQGRNNEAESSLKRALKGNEESLGLTHSTTLTTVKNLAAVYNEQGRYDEAEAFYKRALTGNLEQLGETHPNTLMSMGNLAHVYHNQSRYEEAETLIERAFSGFKEKFGETHPKTLQAIHSRASHYYDQSRYDEAEELFQRALTGNIEILGARHPKTLETMHNLASTYHSQGSYDKAKELYQYALIGRIEIFGARHLETLRTMHNLALNHYHQSRYDEAEELLQQAVTGKKEILGARHPQTLRTMHALASTYGSQRRYDEAKELFQQVLTGRMEALGARHPETLRTMYALALTYGRQRRYDEAKELYQQALTGRIEALGPTHQDTLQTVKDLVWTYRYLGQHQEAKELEKRFPSP